MGWRKLGKPKHNKCSMKSKWNVLTKLECVKFLKEGIEKLVELKRAMASTVARRVLAGSTHMVHLKQRFNKHSSMRFSTDLRTSHSIRDGNSSR